MKTRYVDGRTHSNIVEIPDNLILTTSSLHITSKFILV